MAAIAYWRQMGWQYKNVPDPRTGERTSSVSTMSSITSSLSATSIYSVRPSALSGYGAAAARVP